MLCSRFSRAVLPFVLVLLVFAPLSQAAELRSESPWAVLSQMLDFLVSAWSDNGCRIDPDGRCLPQPPTATADNGCRLDPSGGCSN
jgi:hypothetical protein